jgi:hypothetical protein
MGTVFMVLPPGRAFVAPLLIMAAVQPALIANVGPKRSPMQGDAGIAARRIRQRSTATQASRRQIERFQLFLRQTGTLKVFMSSLATIARAAITLIVTIALADTARAAASCQQAAQHLVTLIKNNWPSSDENTPGATGDMIGTLLHKSSPGFVPATEHFRLVTYSRQAFRKRALRLQNPFAASNALLKALDDLQGNLGVAGLPGTNMFAANSIGGTAHCNSTVFFSVGKGRTRVVQGPKQWENDVGGSCGLTRSFAAIDGVPFIVDDSLDSGPSLASALTLTPWGNGKWLDPCRADFVFAPYFDTKNMQNDWVGLNNWEKNDCGAEGCEGFQRAALNLVRQTQLDRAGVEDHLLAAMTTSQREQYQRLKRIADRPDAADLQTDGDDTDKPRTAAALTDARPLLLPMIVDNRVFLATVGHFSIGWRVFSDWKVTVEAGEADKTREIARFAIAMTQGPILSATVK